MVREYDIVIVGAGLVGAALAAALPQRGWRIALLDAQAQTVTAALPMASRVEEVDLRVSALTEASRALLDSLGAWQEVAPYACAYQGMEVWDGCGTARVHFTAEQASVTELGHIVENRRVVNALRRAVLANPAVEVIAPCRVQQIQPGDHGYRVELEDGRILAANLLVGADGALSQVRTASPLRLRQWAYGHTALVATVASSRAHQAVARQVFLDSGPLAFLPLRDGEGHGQWCSIVWSATEPLASELKAMGDAEFCRALERAFEGSLGAVQSVGPRASFPLVQRHAVDYVRAGLALVGDAAHTIHPLAGQGVNLGFKDVAVLAQELRDGHARGVAPGDLRLLQRYQRRRKGDNLSTMLAMEGFKRLFGADAPVLRWARNEGMRYFDQSPVLKRLAIRRAMGLG